MQRLHLLITTAVVVLACRDGTVAAELGAVHVAVERASYAPADTVTATITNGGRERVGYDPCSGVGFEQRVGSEWVTVGDNRTCNDLGQPVIAAGGSAPVYVAISDSAKPSLYRLRIEVMAVERSSGDVAVVVSNAFTVSQR